MVERIEALVLTEKDKLIRGFVDRRGSLIIGNAIYIAGIDGRRRTIRGQNGEEIRIVDTLIRDKSSPLHLIIEPPKV